MQNLPNTGIIRAIVYYNDNLMSNFSNAVEVQADNTPPTIGNPVGLKTSIIKVNKSTLRLILQTAQMVLELNRQILVDYHRDGRLSLYEIQMVRAVHLELQELYLIINHSTVKSDLKLVLLITPITQQIIANLSKS